MLCAWQAQAPATEAQFVRRHVDTMIYDPSELNEPLPPLVERLARAFLWVAGAGCAIWSVASLVWWPSRAGTAYALVVGGLGCLQLYLAATLTRGKRIAPAAQAPSAVMFWIIGVLYLLVGLALVVLPGSWWGAGAGAALVIGGAWLIVLAIAQRRGGHAA